jgi:hypothetical protein
LTRPKNLHLKFPDSREPQAQLESEAISNSQFGPLFLEEQGPYVMSSSGGI